MRLVPLVLVALAAVGCSPAAMSEQPVLDGRTFVSTAVDGEQIPGGGPLTLEFVDGRVSAFAGCNRGSGAVDLADGRLTTAELATTMMACPPPAGDADAWMTQFLQARPTWALDEDTLTLSTDAATVTLQDRAVVQPDRPLIGTSWRVVSLVSRDAVMTSAALEESKPGLSIGADQTVTGWTGCNAFYGRAQVEDDVEGETVTFEPLNISGPVCAGEVGEIEQSVLRVLTDSVTAVIDADQLTLTGADGDGLVLRAE